MTISNEAIEAAVNANGRASNPKWDHPIMGYQTFSEDQKDYLRDQARSYIESAAPIIRAEALESAADGWQAYIRAMDWGTTAPIEWLRARAAAERGEG